MIKAQIAGLKSKGLLDPDQLWDAVDTLLDEREALLTALRNIAEEAEGGSWVAATAQVAIAKAEAE